MKKEKKKKREKRKEKEKKIKKEKRNQKQQRMKKIMDQAHIRKIQFVVDENTKIIQGQ